MFKGSKKQISAESLKSRMLEQLQEKAASATKRLAEIDGHIGDLDANITAAEEKQWEAEKRLQGFQEDKNPGKKIVDSISDVVLEVQVLERSLKSWYEGKEDLKKEKEHVLHQVKQEAQAIFDKLKAEVQKEIDPVAAVFLELLRSSESALEECRLVDRYVPSLGKYQDVRPANAFKMQCPPLELAGYLREKLPWLSETNWR